MYIDRKMIYHVIKPTSILCSHEDVLCKLDLLAKANFPMPMF